MPRCGEEGAGRQGWVARERRARDSKNCRQRSRLGTAFERQTRPHAVTISPQRLDRDASSTRGHGPLPHGSAGDGHPDRSRASCGRARPQRPVACSVAEPVEAAQARPHVVAREIDRAMRRHVSLRRDVLSLRTGRGDVAARSIPSAASGSPAERADVASGSGRGPARAATKSRSRRIGEFRMAMIVGSGRQPERRMVVARRASHRSRQPGRMQSDMPPARRRDRTAPPAESRSRSPPVHVGGASASPGQSGAASAAIWNR